MIIFLLCKAQNLRITNYLKTFATKQNWNRISEIGGIYFAIFTNVVITLFLVQTCLFLQVHPYPYFLRS